MLGLWETESQNYRRFFSSFPIVGFHPTVLAVRISWLNFLPKASKELLVPSALSDFVFGVGKNDSRLVGRLRSVSQPEFYELTKH